MQILVIPMRRKGIALEPRKRVRCEAIEGNVIVRSTHCEYLGRYANVAWLDAGMPKKAHRLPELLDVTLTTMAHNGLVLSGIEFIDGCA
ncbi:hypothetical protein G7013_06275 [Pseudomonas viridiflava]|uniref:hypothetical protein n=1 Tax=Pseudomonas viridiflava TaxID=33069 RepID=UPI0015E3C6D5|nr:hypothetical protein [Pseudomonas viridiflava]MBA1229250.1 hypothetical protein [Pseudomonas viridiflava]